MSYKLKFLPSALKEWNKIGSTIRGQLKKKLKERSSGYRLVYEVENETVSVFVITVGKRERSSVYIKAARRSIRPNQSGDGNSE
jgi:mRNA interferase RelE/StbE